MGYPIAIGVKFVLLLLLNGASFVAVGRACRRLLFHSSDNRTAADLLLGFFAAPILIAALSAATRLPLWVSFLAVDGLALAVLFARRRATPESSAADDPAPVILPLRVGVSGLLVVFVVALLLNTPYITGLLGLPLRNANVDIGPQIFDIEPAVGVATGLAAYGFPPRHHSASSVPMLYYTGFSVMPAAVGGLFPSVLIPALVGSYVFGAVAYLLVLWQLVSRHLPSFSWRLFAAFLFLSGTTLGVFCWGWTSFFQQTSLRPFVELGFMLNNIVEFLLWQPRHALPAILALLVLEAFASENRCRGLLRGLFFPMTYLFSSSLFVGLFLTPALLVGFALVWWTQNRSSPEGGNRPRLSGSAFACFAALSALVVLPHYWTTVIAFSHAGAPTARLTHALCSPPVVGTLLLSCGLGLLFALPMCFASGRRGGLWLVYLCTLLAAILTSTFNSEFELKGTNILMVLVAFLCALALHRLWVHARGRGLAFRLATLAIFLVVISYALQSLAVSFWNAPSVMPQVFQYRHQITRPGFELVRWVREHTRIKQTVSLVQNDRTVFEPLFGRVAFAAGPDAFYNGQCFWADDFWLKKHLQAHPDLASGLKGSDYVVLCHDPLGFGDPRIVDAHFEEHRQLLRNLGFTIVMENPAGLVARNPASRRPASPVHAALPGSGGEGR